MAALGTGLRGTGLAELVPQAVHGRAAAWAASGIGTYSRFSPRHLPASAAEIGVALVPLGTGMLEASCAPEWEMNRWSHPPPSPLVQAKKSPGFKIHLIEKSQYRGEARRNLSMTSDLLCLLFPCLPAANAVVIQNPLPSR